MLPPYTGNAPETELYGDVRCLTHFLASKSDGEADYLGKPLDEWIEEVLEKMENGEEFAELWKKWTGFNQKWVWAKQLVRDWQRGERRKPDQEEIEELLWSYESAAGYKYRQGH